MVLADGASRAVLSRGVFSRQLDLAVVLATRGDVSSARAEHVAACVLQRLIALLDVWCLSQCAATELLHTELVGLRPALASSRTVLAA